jgi:AcrR family transcriptional regulator
MPATAHATDEPPRRMRADARRNRDRIVAAAVELVAEHGVDVPFDTVARHAEVGIGTLYRRFPDRESLVTAVALAAFTSVRDLAHEVTDRPEGSRLAAFVLGVAELRVGVLMTGLRPAITPLDRVPGLETALQEVHEAVSELVAAAHDAGELRRDVTVDDLLLLLAVMTRPVEGLPADHADATATRQLHLALEGLRPRADAAPLPPAPALPTRPGSVPAG